SISAVVATAVLVLGTVAVAVAVTVTVTVAVSITATNRVDLYEVSVVVDMDMIANAAFAGVEAVGQGGPLDDDIVVAVLVQGLLAVIHSVRASASGTKNQNRQGPASNAGLGLPQHALSPLHRIKRNTPLGTHSTDSLLNADRTACSRMQCRSR